MKNLSGTVLVLISQVFIIAACSNANSNVKQIALPEVRYVCMPCGRNCDTAMYKAPGRCNSCMMDLVDKKTVDIKNINPAALCNFIAGIGRENIVLLDVRTSEEFNGTATDKFGKLAGAVNIPVQELEKRAAELNNYKSKQIIVYCSHSHRSPMASYILMQKGFIKVSNMEFGMSEWQNKVKKDSCNSKLYVSQ
ncbi:rhodanese-like domain-containing protein [Ferruginibacter sp.]